MTVRSATADPTCPCWRSSGAHSAPRCRLPPTRLVDDATELAEIRGIVEAGLGWVAEKDGAAVGCSWRSVAAPGWDASPIST